MDSPDRPIYDKFSPKCKMSEIELPDDLRSSINEILEDREHEHALKKEGLNLTTWSFLLSLNNGEDLYYLEDVEEYAFVAQHLGVLGLIKLCDDDTDKLYCLTSEGYNKILEINENTEQGLQNSDS